MQLDAGSRLSSQAVTIAEQVKEAGLGQAGAGLLGC